jgi:exosortase A
MLSLLWLLANVTGVQILQQLLMITIIIVTILIIVGRSIISTILFPLFFLYLSVPFGTSLTPTLMDFTAHFVVIMVQMVGIPIYQEGLYFNLPSGSWSVVEACSGLNYFVAGITLGLLYAYLTYHSIKKRLIFIAVIIVVSILGNWLRAFGTVMIGHYSDMKYGTGGDHTFYGWIFFGLIICGLFYIGNNWRDPEPHSQRSVKGPINIDGQNFKSSPIIPIISFLVILSSALYASHVESIKSIKTRLTEFTLPSNFGSWQEDSNNYLGWQPENKTADVFITKTYRFGIDRTQMSIAYYTSQKQGAEVVSSSNGIPALSDQIWKKVRYSDIKEGSSYVTETELKSHDGKVLVWSWYKLGQYDTPNPYIVKVFDAFNQIAHNRNDGAWIVLATPLNKSLDYSRSQLKSLLANSSDDINKSIKNLYLNSTGDSKF